MYEKIPDELKKLNQWVCWRGVPDENRPGKIKKIPINPKTGGQAQSNNSDTWTCFRTALLKSANFDGIGFMFDKGYFGIDIDGAEEAIEDYRRGETENIIFEFIHTLESYAEYSISGKGIHIICKGSLPPAGRRKNNVEMYERGRFFIMTGNIAANYFDIAEGTHQIKSLHEKYIGGGKEPSVKTRATAAVSLSEKEIIELAKKSKQGKMFSDLYEGKWENYFVSQSEADLSFCNRLAFWCGRDKQLIDSIFRSSGLMREKWNRKQSGSTYGNITIDEAVSSCKNVFEPTQEYSVIIGNPKKKMYTLDDTGNAERLIDGYGELIRFSHTNRKWFYYDGRRWCCDITGAIRRIVDEVVESMRNDLEYYVENAPEGIDAGDMEKAYLKHIKASRSNRAKTAMINESQHRAPIKPDQFDRHKFLLNTPNGTINLKTGELAVHNKSNFITKITHAEYTDKTDTPLWEQFLNDIFSQDKDVIRFMQKAIGYSLTGDTREDCIFFCYGTGRNGKSTFLNTIAGILGEYAINVQPETIMMKHNSNGPTSDIARLKSSRFVIVPEPSEGMRLNEGLIKQMTGGDTMT